MPLRITPQTLIPAATDPTITTTSYANGFQNIPPLSNVGNVYVTNTTQTTVNIINKIGVAGSNSQIQFNLNGKLKGDAYLTYNNTTHALNVGGVALIGAVRTDALQYANGVPWPTDYGNAQVANYLPINSSNVSGNNFIGNGWRLSYLNPANIDGPVANAVVSGTVYSNAQPNITSIGELSGLSVNGDATVNGNLTVTGNTYYVDVTTLNIKDPIIEMGGNPNGDPLTSNDGKDRGSLLHYYTTDPIDAFMGWDNSNGEFALGSNVSVIDDIVTFNAYGNVRADRFIGNGALLSSINGSNVTSGQVANALVASTVYTNAQPNITSTGTLSGLTVNGTTTITNNGYLNVQNTAPSTNQTSGAIITAGGIGASGNVHAQHIHANLNIYAKNTVYAGNNAISTSLTAPVFIGKDTGDAYVQAAVLNSSNTGSADWAAYGDSGDENNGWTDIGYAGTAFDDPNYTVTSASDGYLFVQGMPGQGGNLVIATGGEGSSTHRDIVFAVGGFATENVFGRISYANLALEIISDSESTSKTTGSITTLGGIGANGNIYANAFYGDGTNVTNVSVSGSQTGITAVGTLSGVDMGGSILAHADDNYDIGNSSNRFRNLSLSANADIGGILTVSGVSNLGPAGNLIISGGNNGDVLTTDGSGNLTWAPASGGAGIANLLVDNTTYTPDVWLKTVGGVNEGIYISPDDNISSLSLPSSSEDLETSLVGVGNNGLGLYSSAAYVKINSSNVIILTDKNTTNNQWIFGADGSLTIPNAKFDDPYNDGALNLVGTEDKYGEILSFDKKSAVWVSDSTWNYPIGGGVGIATDLDPVNGTGGPQWLFGSDGNLQIPGIINSNNGVQINSLLGINALVSGLTGLEITSTEIGVFTNNVKTWAFDSYGNLTSTTSANISTNGTITASNIVAESPFSIKTSDFSADAGKRYGVDTTSSTVTATLPASPATGSAIFFADAGGAYSTNNLTIDAGLNTIMGGGTTMTVSTNNQSIGLFYNGTTWRIYNAG
jgi:hypothetical protein